MPDPVPAAGVAAAARCMESGRLFRRGAAYNVASKEESEVSQVEDEFAAFTGHNFALGLNSCGSAIFLMLKCAGAEHGDKVLTNGFTFTAVPSAIVHAGCEPVYVETTPGYVVDVPDLIKKMDAPGRQVLHRVAHAGKIASMDEVREACEARGVVLLEDCAHSLGVLWNGAHTGHHGSMAAFAAELQDAQLRRGRLLVCDDDFKFAKAMAYAGAYEILTIEKRRAVYNERYYRIAARLDALPGVSVESQRDEVTIVGDSVQFNVEAAVFGDDLEAGANAFIAQCEARLPVSFGREDERWNFKNWRYGPQPDCGLPATADIISRAFDVRLPLLFEEEDFDVMIEIVSECLDNAA
ncbi:aminotransferase [Aureococcus anophagefferens]|nr:aminotransferase [Aureococcus anophagefferens]